MKTFVRPFILMSSLMTALSMLLGLVGCVTNTFTVTSEPPQAEVFVSPPDAKERKSIGKTPVTIPMKDVKELLGADVSSGEYFPVFIEKQGFKTETLQVPASRFGTLVTAVDVKLKEGVVEMEEKTARAVIDHLFLAQKYAVSQQFERAHVELDKIIADFPNFARALSMRASVYYAQKNFNESLKWYDEALKADPQMDDAVKMAAKIRGIQSGGISDVRTPANEKSKKR